MLEGWLMVVLVRQGFITGSCENYIHKLIVIEINISRENYHYFLIYLNILSTLTKKKIIINSL
jgi:hypothetical protein